MRKNRKWDGGGWLEGRITTRDLKEDSDGGQMFAARIVLGDDVRLRFPPSFHD